MTEIDDPGQPPSPPSPWGVAPGAAAPPTPWGAPPPAAQPAPGGDTGPAAGPTTTTPPADPPASPIWGGAPAAPSWSAPGAHTQVSGPGRWYSLRGLSTALSVVLAVCIALSFASVVTVLRERSAFQDAVADFWQLSRYDDARALAHRMTMFTAVAAMVVGVLLIIWMWRAAKDLQALGRFQPTLSAGWAIGGWFVPFASFVLPCIVAVGLWKGSDATIPGGNVDWKRARISPLLWIWWVAWVANLVLVNAFLGAQPDDSLFSTTDEYLRQNSLQVAWLLVLAVAGVLCAVFVRRVTSRFEATLAAQQAAWAAQQPSVN